MHGAIWKLSAVATVVGFGLLAVVLQQNKAGKGLVEQTAGADGAGEGDSGEGNNTDKNAAAKSDLPQQGELGPDVSTPPPPKTGESSDLDQSVTLSETIEDGTDEFAPKPPSPRTSPGKSTATHSAQVKAVSGARPELGDEELEPLKTAGSRGRKAPEAGEAFEEGDLGTPATPAPPQPRARQSGQVAAQNEDGEDANDPLMKGRSGGRPAVPPADAGDSETSDAVVGQAPNTRPRIPDESIEETVTQTRTGARSGTGPRSGAGPRTSPRQNPRRKLTDEGDESGQSGTPMPVQIGDEPNAGGSQDLHGQSPAEQPDRSAPNSARRGSRMNAAMQDENEIPHGGRPGSATPPAEIPAAEPRDESAFSDTSGNSPRRSRNLPEIEAETDVDPARGLPPKGAEELTPTVPRSRKRPSISDDDPAAENVPAQNGAQPAAQNGTQPAADPNAPQPIRKIERTEHDVVDQGTGASPQARNGRGRPNALMEDDAQGNGPAPMYPVGRQRPRIDGDESDATPSADASGSVPNPSTTPREQEIPDSTNPSSPSAGVPPVPASRSNGNQTPDRPRIEEDPADAAASGDSATNVLAPRTQPVPSAMPGINRGRAKVSIEKLAPPTAVLGQPLIYSIVVRNNGSVPARQVVVEDTVPDGVKMDGSIPQAEMTGQKIKWTIGSLEPGQEQRISVRVIPLAEGPVGSAATVNFVHDLRGNPTNREDNGQGLVTLDLISPQQVTVGQLFEVRFRLSNRTNSQLSKLTILNQLPSSLRHESRRPDLIYTVETLAPREILEVTLSLTASQTGPAVSRAVVLTQDERILVTKEFRVDVTTGNP